MKSYFKVSVKRVEHCITSIQTTLGHFYTFLKQRMLFFCDFNAVEKTFTLDGQPQHDDSGNETRATGVARKGLEFFLKRALINILLFH